jgi:hypothetical protein
MGGGDSECDSATDCDDSSDCTADRCDSGSCVHDLDEGLCSDADNTCLSEILTIEPYQGCAPGQSTDAADICTDTTCTGGDTMGCDVNMTFGAPTAETSVNGDTRTTIYTIPMTDISMSGNLDGAAFNCEVTLAMTPDMTAKTTVTITSEVAAACGTAEEILSVETEFDRTNIVLGVIPDTVDDAALCELAKTYVQTNLGSQIDAVLSGMATAAVGELETLIGADCGACEFSECEGLSCDPTTFAD